MAKFDQIWVSNRFRYRKGMTGTKLRLDEATGYLECSFRRGFSAAKKKVFIERFRICCNCSQICDSLFINVQSMYDAIALDAKFRNDFIETDLIEGRKKQLNDEMIKVLSSEKNQIMSDLSARSDRYK